VKIGIFGIPEIALGKHDVRDPRLDEVNKLVKAKNKTYVQAELVGQDSAFQTDALLVLSDSRIDLILKDLEFVETRLNRTEDPNEKIMLNKLKLILEKEELIFNSDLSGEEKQAISQYNLFTNKPVIAVQRQELSDLDSLLMRVLEDSGFISFFTITGGNEARAWLIRQGTTAWEAAGAVHSDIQKGFIRAEVISLADFIQAGGEMGAKQQGKMHLEQKDYIIQDADIINFRFSK
jgi:ribosome-binding ATPase YchF (GTP1/OBG family)